MKCTIDSKTLPNVTPNPSRHFWPHCAKNCAKYFHWTIPVPESSNISLACRFIFSKASRFICNFI